MSVTFLVFVLTPNRSLPPPSLGTLTRVSSKVRSVLWSTFALG